VPPEVRQAYEAALKAATSPVAALVSPPPPERDEGVDLMRQAADKGNARRRARA
jgi:hypothetical protein